jgi:hypothetical protein
MVKESSNGTGRRNPRNPAESGDTRTKRLVLRTHPDLMEVLTVRSRERGLTRSAYVEQLLIGWVRLDPRNRRLDMIGKYVPGGVDPEDVKRKSPLAFAERWRRFTTASQLLLGAPPPSDWFDDQEYGLEPETDPDVHRKPAADEQPNPPFKRKR